ncbi:MAG: hypothetical protein AAGD18_05635 [Actinomycetota bacterium]
MIDRLPLRACLLVAALLLAACAGDSDDDAAPAAGALAATTTTELPILLGSGASATSIPPAGTAAPGDTAPPGSTAAPDETVAPEDTAAPAGGGSPSSSTTSTTAAPSGPPADPDTCAALASLVSVVDADALATISASADQNSLELVDVLRVLEDQEATPAARAIAGAKLDDLAGLNCGLDAPPTVTLQPDGLDVAAFGQERGLVSSAVSTVLGPPSIDTGPIDPISAYGTCPGEQIWVMEWPFLVLLFLDDGAAPESFDLFAWRSFDVGEDPIGPVPATIEGVAVGVPFDGIVERFATRGATVTRDEVLGVDVIDVPGTYLIIDDGSGDVGTIEGGLPCGE